MCPSPNLALPYISSGQAQKEVTHNEALNDLDVLTQLSVLERTLNSPPSAPNDGDCYIVGAAPTGAWAGAAGKIAAYFSGWILKTPLAGWCAWVRPENRLMVYGDSAWRNLATPFLEVTLSWMPGAIAAGAGVTSASVSISGAAFGDFVAVAAPYDLQGVTATAYVSAANNSVIRLHNSTSATVTLATGSWKIRVHKQ